MIFGDRLIINENSERVREMRFHFYHSKLFRNYKNIGQEATFWRKEIFYQVGGIDESLNYAIDLDLWCRFSKHTELKYLPFFLGAFRQQSASKTSTIGKVGNKEREKIVLKYFGRLPTEQQMKFYNFFSATFRRLYRRLGISALKRTYYIWLQALSKTDK